eukprot:2814807-Pyramimonas_sp.AAC.1
MPGGGPERGERGKRASNRSIEAVETNGMSKPFAKRIAWRREGGLEDDWELESWIGGGRGIELRARAVH